MNYAQYQAGRTVRAAGSTHVLAFRRNLVSHNHSEDQELHLAYRSLELDSIGLFNDKALGYKFRGAPSVEAFTATK